jgi:hypothetical protein
MKIKNKVILLIPHYKNVKGLKTSLLSIGNKENLDVLIVDDGSNIMIDEEDIRNCFLGQGNVSFIYLKENKGIEIALNTGLKYILDKKYELTSRLDCGDICVKDRFKQQQSFLEKNKDIVLVGSNVNFVDTSGNLVYVLKVPEKDKRIRKKMFINAMHIHPTIMFRNKILESTGLYPVDFKAAEDYAFFFNILNNLYGLVSKDAGKAQKVILKLSDLMRYSIYESENEMVTLKEEVDYLKNYIELHKMRYHKNIVVNFNCDIDENKRVAPLLFIILLENAFKHGVERIRENASVTINFTSSESDIKFEIENNFDSSENLENKAGIGLKNLKRRLELTYPNKHNLLLSSTERSYSAKLILN